MNGAQSGTLISKAAIVILVAVVTAIVVTLLQRLSLGEARPAITGGVVGAITAMVAFNVMRKNSTTE